MKDKSSKPLPNRGDSNPEDLDSSDRGIWNQSLADGEWHDAPIDKNEEGVWESDLVNREWRDADIDEDEIGVWEQPAIAEWTEAPETDEREESQKDGMIFLPKIVENLSYPLIPLIGYGFLGLTLFDHINIIYPAKIFEPTWIVETLGQITERIPTLWIGLLLVFFRREGFTRKWELGVLKFLSWLTLILGIIYLLMTPMLIGNTARVYRLIDTQIDAKASEQSQKLERAKEQINATNEKDISAYLQYQRQNSSINRTLNTPPVQSKQFKENLLLQANRNLSELQVNTQNYKTSQFTELIKRTAKWTLGNLLSTFVCVWIWHLTRWTRIKNLELDSVDRKM